MLRLPKNRFQLRSPDGRECLAEARAKPPNQGVFASGDAIWRWDMGQLQVIDASGTTTLLQPELLTNGAGWGNQLLILAKYHDGNGSVLYDTQTRESTQVKMRPSDHREHVFLSPGAAYAVGWEKMRDIKVYPKCGARAKRKYRHEDFGLQLLRFSDSGEHFAYLTDWWRVYVWDGSCTEPVQRFDTVANGQIRALAYEKEALWIAAGEGLFRIIDGEPVTRFTIDGDRVLCVLRGGLVAVPI